MCKDLLKVYPDGTAAVLNNSFSVQKGEVVGLLGPNGAGKSSMFNLLTLELQRSGGNAKLLSSEIDELELRKKGS